YNEAFIIDGLKREELIKKCPEADSIIRPILRGRDIHRYKNKYSDLWLINTHNGLKSKNVEKINVEIDYPAIYTHLQQFETELKKRTDKGDHWTNLRNCVYFEEFLKPKIIYPETMRIHKNDLENFPRFTYDESGFFCDKTIFFIAGKNLIYLLGYLNSGIFKFLLPKYVSAWDDSGFMLQKIYLDLIPVIRPDEKLLKEIERNVIAINKSNEDLEIREISTVINNLFYSFLDLTSLEINYIESINEISSSLKSQN
ncbi:MAG: restriction endonuclease, partial [Bacteroidetes bacterium HGW-Bacteroidetes-23]